LSTERTDSSIDRFWEIEDYPKVKAWSEEELLCEKHFVATTKRDETGRFIVTLPFKISLDLLRDTRNNATKRFYNIERKLDQAFIDEYKQLKHMTRVEDTLEDGKYFLPYNGVIKEMSTTTRLRVVFDASA